VSTTPSDVWHDSTFTVEGIVSIGSTQALLPQSVSCIFNDKFVTAIDYSWILTSDRGVNKELLKVSCVHTIGNTWIGRNTFRIKVDDILSDAIVLETKDTPMVQSFSPQVLYSGIVEETDN
jgi:hypothetical protein